MRRLYAERLFDFRVGAEEDGGHQGGEEEDVKEPERSVTRT
eukprot:CAMPEP_0119201382 /NCGR_PEP_ID=MMETSP1316-20130426/28956_1 /TAXON_ID=41880 /ORGANISM="Pycnococcus provasolii, Strain RCC2336" /LENGTH=40 /DNA_ID= /DNA_START= /DNA_END= /DNA_ORIENTATION=